MSVIICNSDFIIFKKKYVGMGECLIIVISTPKILLYKDMQFIEEPSHDSFLFSLKLSRMSRQVKETFFFSFWMLTCLTCSSLSAKLKSAYLLNNLAV